MWFAAKNLDKHGFVVDFSSLGSFENKLSNQFDHTFLVNADDPLLPEWQKLHKKGALDLRVMENVGMEATARLVWEWANQYLEELGGKRACCWKVEARENKSNAAFFLEIPSWFKDASK